MQVKFVSCLVVLGLSGAVLADSVGAFDSATGTLTYDIATAATETQTFLTYGPVTKVVKKGAGELILSASNGTWAGEVSVKAGVLHDKAPRTSDDYCTGVGKASAVRVSSGGQFKSTQSFGWDRQGLDNYPGVTFTSRARDLTGRCALWCHFRTGRPPVPERGDDGTGHGRRRARCVGRHIGYGRVHAHQQVHERHVHPSDREESRHVGRGR